MRGCRTPGVAGALCLAVLLAGVVARAGDEDISPSAYQVFDPETGFMVPADQLAAAQHAPANGHAPDESAPASRRVYALLPVALLAAFLLWRRARRQAALRHDQ